MTLFDKTTEEKKTFTVQDIAQREGYWGERTIQRICEKQGYQKASGGKYNIPESDLHLFRRPEKIPKTKEKGATREGNPPKDSLLDSDIIKASDQTNFQTTESHIPIVEEIEKIATKSASNNDEMEKPEKPELESKENLHDLPKAKKEKPFTGYIHLYKAIRNWRYAKEPFTRLVFEELLLTANYQDEEFIYTDMDDKGKEKKILIKRGQVTTSIRQIAESTGISLQSVRTALKKLQSTQEIIKHELPKYIQNHLFSLYDIPNYVKYQPQPKNAKKQRKIHSQDKQQKPFKPRTEEERIAYSILQGINEESFHNYQPTQNNLQPIINQLRRGYTEEELEEILQNKLSDIEENRYTGEPDPSMHPSILYGDDFDEWREISGILAKH
jgi:DNA-binding Lrp family transcriptional regulator